MWKGNQIVFLSVYEENWIFESTRRPWQFFQNMEVISSKWQNHIDSRDHECKIQQANIWK